MAARVVLCRLRINEYLEMISEHASQLTALELVGIDANGAFSHIWAHLIHLEELTITTEAYVPNNTMFTGIAHHNRHLRKLLLGDIFTKAHLSAAVGLCQAFGSPVSSRIRRCWWTAPTFA